MPKFDYDVVVVGGGAAGLTSSIWSAQLGSRTLLVEKEEKLGGDCLHYGCVPSKSLIKSAHVYHLMKTAETYGLPKASYAPVDFAKVRDRIHGIIATIQKNDSPEVFKKNHGIDTKFGGAKFVDEHTLDINGKRLTSKKIILATGSSPRIVPVEGLEKVKYLTNINVFSLDELPESMIVMGGGPIGVELAQAFQRLGSAVTVVETEDRIMSREDDDVSGFIHDVLAAEGVRFETGARGTKVEQSGDTITLVIERKDGTKATIAAKALLMATGRSPNINGLDLEQAGVAYDRTGIPVNRNLQTSQKHIFACGDCNGGFQFTHVAEYEARLAALNARLPFPLLKTDYTSIVWCTFTDPEAASVGLNERTARQKGIDCKVYTYPFTHIDRALAESDNQGFAKILTDHKRRLVGAQIIGPHAGELIHEWVAALNGKMDIGRLEKAMHVYPTLSQINKKVSGHYLSGQSALIKIMTYLLK